MLVLAAALLACLAPSEGPAVESPPNGSRPADFFGSAIAAAGDLDADGVPDFLVGDPLGGPGIESDANRHEGYSRGRVWMLSGADGSPIGYVLGDFTGDRLGQVVVAAGDLDGDGTQDFLAAAPGSQMHGDGYVRAYSPAKRRVLGTYPVSGTSRGWFSRGVSPAVCATGDLDSDGADDFAIGASLASDDAERAGSVRFVSGRTGGTLYRANGEQAEDLYGLALARVDDLDEDGVSEIAVGARRRVDVLSGRSGELLLRSRAPKDWPHAFGGSVCQTGDLDGDGHGDLAVGCVPYGRESRAALYSSSSGEELKRLLPRGRGFGVLVRSWTDLNGDELPELIVTAPRKANYGGGELWVLDPATDSVLRRHAINMTDQEFMAQHEEGLPADYAALAVANIGDVDGDGTSDLAIGETYDDCSGCVGSVAVFSGADGERLFVVTSPEVRRACLRGK